MIELSTERLTSMPPLLASMYAILHHAATTELEVIPVGYEISKVDIGPRDDLGSGYRGLVMWYHPPHERTVSVASRGSYRLMFPHSYYAMKMSPVVRTKRGPGVRLGLTQVRYSTHAEKSQFIKHSLGTLLSNQTSHGVLCNGYYRVSHDTPNRINSYSTDGPIDHLMDMWAHLLDTPSNFDYCTVPLGSYLACWLLNHPNIETGSWMLDVVERCDEIDVPPSQAEYHKWRNQVNHIWSTAGYSQRETAFLDYLWLWEQNPTVWKKLKRPLLTKKDLPSLGMFERSRDLFASKDVVSRGNMDGKFIFDKGELLQAFLEDIDPLVEAECKTMGFCDYIL